MIRRICMFVLSLPAVLNLPTRPTFKRSPLDIKTSFDELPRLFLPPNLHHKVPIALSPILAPHQTVRLLNGVEMQQYISQKHSKGPYIDHKVQHQILIHGHIYPAISNSHKTSLHTDIKHIITHDNQKIPVLTQTISHSSSNVTHPVKFFVPIHHGVLVPVPKPLVLLHDTSVIPLHHRNILTDPGDHNSHLANLVSSMDNRQRSEPITADSSKDIDMFRSPVGGFGTGLRFGGQGAGHGFFAYS